MTIPREARDGLSRAWLAHLREQHPGITWVIVNDTETDDDGPVSAAANQEASATCAAKPG